MINTDEVIKDEARILLSPKFAIFARDLDLAEHESRGVKCLCAKTNPKHMSVCHWFHDEKTTKA
jgi:hypothetical protein